MRFSLAILAVSVGSAVALPTTGDLEARQSLRESLRGSLRGGSTGGVTGVGALNTTAFTGGLLGGILSGLSPLFSLGGLGLNATAGANVGTRDFDELEARQFDRNAFRQQNQQFTNGIRNQTQSSSAAFTNTTLANVGSLINGIFASTPGFGGNFTFGARDGSDFGVPELANGIVLGTEDEINNIIGAVGSFFPNVTAKRELEERLFLGLGANANTRLNTTALNGAINGLVGNTLGFTQNTVNGATNAALGTVGGALNLTNGIIGSIPGLIPKFNVSAGVNN